MSIRFGICNKCYCGQGVKDKESVWVPGGLTMIFMWVSLEVDGGEAGRVEEGVNDVAER